MNKKVFQTLEFYKILNVLKGYTQNEKVQERILALEPETDLTQVEKLQRETTEATGVLLRRGNAPGFTVTDVTGAVMRTERGGVMNMGELLSLCTAMASARRLKTYIAEDKPSEETSIRGLSDAIVPLKQVEDEINEKIIGPEEMADGASNTLLQSAKDENPGCENP